MRVVQSFRASGGTSRDFRERQRALPRANQQTVVLNGLYFPFVDFLSTVAIADRARLRRLPRVRGVATVGTLFAFMLYLSNFFDPVQELSQLYNTFLSAVAALDKISGHPRRGARGRRRARRPRLAGSTGTSRFEDVRFAYGRGARGAARDRPRRPRRDDGRARRPHRRGKSTIAKLLARFYDPTRRADHDRRRRPPRGHAGVAAAPARDRPAGGVPLRRHGAREHRVRPPRRNRRRGRRRRAGGRRARFITRARGRLRHASSASAARASRSASASSSRSRARSSPTRASSILDEATSSVDIGTERRIELALRTLLAGRTAFIIAHRLSTIRDADLIVVLEHGQVVEQGSHEELLAPRGLYTSLYGDWAADVA